MTEIRELFDQTKKELDDIKASIDIAGKETRIAEIEALSVVAGFWDDVQKAQKLMQEMGDLRNDVDEVKSLTSEISNLAELAVGDDIDELSDEIRKIAKRVSTLRIKTYLSEKYDTKNALVSIHAGQGGTEAMDWTSMLYRMYVRYAERRGWKLSTIDVSDGDEAGLKSIVFLVEGAYAYGYLKGEIGAHRLVRQSPFNADKLRQTSFASVEVLPELAEMDSPDIEIREEDVDWQFYRAGGHGGQNVNKVSTAVRLIHIPTGIVVTAQTERYQEQNRKHALDLLRAKLWIRQQEMEDKEKKDLKGEYKPPSWGHQIRSYVLHPYKMVKDLRTDHETSDAEGVLDGDLDEFIDAELALGKC